MAYKGYKTADIPWISTVPDTWNVNRGKALFYNPKEINKNGKYNNVLSLTLRGVIRNDVDNPIGLSPKSYDTYQLFEKDDLVFKLIDLENISTSRVGLVGEQGIMSSAYIRTTLREKTEHNIKYFYYQYYSLYLRNIFNGLGAGVRQTLSAGDLLSLKILVPTKEEQDQIVKYLDWKVSEINRYIRQNRETIKRLEELEKRVIDFVITNGIRRERELKLSKALWMGMVPCEWKDYRLKYVFREINDRSEDGSEPHLSMSQKKGLVTDDEAVEKRLLSESYAGAKLCDKDDLVLNRLKAHLGVFALAPMHGVVSPDYTVLRLDTSIVIPQYLEYYLKSNACRGELVTRVRGIVEGFWRLYTEDLGTIPICIPDLDEQQEIIDYIKKYDSEIRTVINGIREQINYIEELRTKIIADVVAGQIDVRDVVIPEYEIQTEDSYDNGIDDEDTFSDDLTE